MTEPRPVLKLNLPIRKDILLSKLPPSVVVAMQKAQKKTEVKPKAEVKAKEKKQPVAKEVKEVPKPSKKDKKILAYESYSKILKHLRKKYPDKFTNPVSLLPPLFYKEVLSEWKKTTISKNEVKKFFRAYALNKKYKELMAAKQKKPTPEILPPKKKALVSYKLYEQMLNHFQAKYPKCFTTPPQPFATGIHKQLFEDEVELGVSRKQLRVFCSIYCRKPEYIDAFKIGVSRIDLLGNVTTTIAEEEFNSLQELLNLKENQEVSK
jgi:hypothetical protein